MRYKILVSILVIVIGFSLFFHVIFRANTIVQRQMTRAEFGAAWEQAYSEGYSKGYSIGVKTGDAKSNETKVELPAAEAKRAEILAILSDSENQSVVFGAEYAKWAKEYNSTINNYNESLKKSLAIREAALSAPAGDTYSSITMTFAEVGALNETLNYANKLVKRHNEIMSKTMEHMNDMYASLQALSEKVADSESQGKQK